MEKEKKEETMVCDHRIVLKKICCKCGLAVDESNLMAFDFLDKGLKLSPQYVGFMKSHALRHTLQEKKKLHLVLNLFGILYDFAGTSTFSEREKYLIGEVDSRDDLWPITVDSHKALIKLRPFVTEFLREANKLFTLHAYTMSAPEHGECMIKLLDPDQTYFGRRVICRGDMWWKTLDLVLVDERVLVILDDESVTWWTDHTNHLVQIKKYRYFKHPTQQSGFVNFFKRNLLRYSRDHLAPKFYSEEGLDESRDDGGLANALKFLKNLHQQFFQGAHKDVRMLLQA